MNLVPEACLWPEVYNKAILSFVHKICNLSFHSTFQSEALQNIQKESDSILSAYRHFFDEMLVNNDVDESVKGVEEAIERASSTPQWVPISWVY